MSGNLDETLPERPPKPRRGPKPPATQGGGAVYGLGFIGALVWFCRQAAQPGDYAVAVLKSLVWPAFLVYHAFEVLDGLRRDRDRGIA